MKIRGTAAQIHEKYLSLSRDAVASGDRIAAENYLQHADHYARILMAMQEQLNANQRFSQGASGDADDDEDEVDVGSNGDRAPAEEAVTVTAEAEAIETPQAAAEVAQGADDDAKASEDGAPKDLEDVPARTPRRRRRRRVAADTDSAESDSPAEAPAA